MKKLIIQIIVSVVDLWKSISFKNDLLLKLNFVPGLESWRWLLGKWRSYLQFEKAIKEVPAYTAFIQEQSFKLRWKGLIPQLQNIPIMDKKNYIQKFSLNDRCVGGKIPATGVVVDESSGSSGKPTSWVRGEVERTCNKKMIQFGIKHVFGDENLFIINAFAMGAWATGVNVTMSCVEISILKSLGPDQQKIINTLQDFGPNYRYIVMGYPPFLKILVDQAPIDWKSYDIHFIFGGEAMSESLRKHLLDKGISSVRSSLGASDLELNIALENDFTIELRQMILSNPQLAKELTGQESGNPMIFQYNPADFFMETNKDQELIVTIARPGYIAPKIRYNIHDRAKIIRKKELIKALKTCGIAIESFQSPMVLDFPLLFHFGRADMTVSYFGSNISPNDINDSLCQVDGLAHQFSAFRIHAFEDNKANKRLQIFIELYANFEVTNIQKQEIQAKFLQQLAVNNQDFREALAMMPVDSYPELIYCETGHPIFEDNDIRIKLNYILDKSA